MADSLLVDFHSPLEAEAEDLEIEFKLALPLAENSGKAKLAKEIGALANHGGGWIVLGRDEDGSYPSQPPAQLQGADQDSINQLVSAYLTPAPHCAVRWVQPRNAAFQVLVVRVPGVGTAPVCGSKNGPNDNKGKTIGIRKGVHYIRKAGPVSAPIETPDEWQELIRRCVLSDKTALLGALTTMIERPSPPPEEETPSVMDADAAHMVQMWQENVTKLPADVDFSQNFVCYSFDLLGDQSTTIDDIKNCLRRRPPETNDPHAFFDDGHPAAGRPGVIENAGIDGLEVDATGDCNDLKAAWRLSEALSGTEIVSYWEDTNWVIGAVEGRSSRKWEKGKKLWISSQIAYANSFFAIVRHFADYFEHHGKIRVRVRFQGLKGRTLDAPRGYYSLDYIAQQNTKQVDMTLERAALAVETVSATIASLIQPINKLTQGPMVTPDYVVKALKTHQ